jgi:hypothetical protein
MFENEKLLAIDTAVHGFNRSRERSVWMLRIARMAHFMMRYGIALT